MLDVLPPVARGALLVLSLLVPASGQDGANTVVWEGVEGPGKGKHIVLIAGDHEYRGEETLPALGRILAKRFGFKCTFVVTTDPKTGEIRPGSNHITGLEVLRAADLMVVFLRFQAFADDQMQHIEDYLASGRPVLGLRTSTHAFKGLRGRFAKFNEGYRPEGADAVDAAWRFGFGEHVLGEHWVGHFGRNHRQSSRVVPEEEAARHPILRGVQDVHVVSGGYVGHPVAGSTVLARGQVLDGMEPDAPATVNERQQVRHAVAWVRHYRDDKPRSRVFTTTHGASEDIRNEGFRRMLVNAHLWCLGLEEAITPEADVGFVGPYHPVTYRFGGHRLGVEPADIAGWDSPIYDPAKPVGERKKRRKRKK